MGMDFHGILQLKKSDNCNNVPIHLYMGMVLHGILQLKRAKHKHLGITTRDLWLFRLIKSDGKFG